MRSRFFLLLGDAVVCSRRARRSASLARPATRARSTDDPRGLADAPELGARLDLDAVHDDPPLGRLAVDVVADAGGEGEAEQLTAVRRQPTVARLRRDVQALLTVVGRGGDAYLIRGRRIVRDAAWMESMAEMGVTCGRVTDERVRSTLNR